MRKSEQIIKEARGNPEAMMSVILLENNSVAKVCASWRLTRGMIKLPDEADTLSSLWPDELPENIIEEITSATMYQAPRVTTLIKQLRQHGIIFPDGTIHKAAQKYLLNQVKSTLE